MVAGRGSLDENSAHPIARINAVADAAFVAVLAAALVTALQYRCD